MSVTCPRCNAEHDGKSDARGWATCRACVFIWQLAGKPPSEPVLRKPRADYGRSDEYAPLENNPQSSTAPLTMREGAQPSGKHPVISPIAESKPKAPLRAAAAPVSSEEIDSQLFDRMELDAQQRRSNQETLVQPSSSASRKASSEQGTCPVCGHRFALIGKPPAEIQTCPQCSTSFNLRNGQLVGESSDETAGGDLLIGRTIRGCFIDRKVGEGGMGSVYHARQLSLDRSVAIKVMPAELTRNKNFIQRFEREAKSLARINHPNILHIYDFGEESALGIYFMIIEFVDGKDLGEVLRSRETITQEEVLDILRQALLGLEMASEKGVIHRDIKPDNLMIAKDGLCKVSDFGLAKGYGAFDEVTTAGVRVGTPAFMSPEQCDGIEVDVRSDVYSLGCTVYLALTGYLPFGGDSPFSIMLKHKTDPPPSMRTHRPEIDPRIDELVLRMLAKKPDDRCRTLRELIDVVEDLQVALAGGLQRRASSSGDRSKALNDSGAVKLLPDLPDPGLPAMADLPAASSSRGGSTPAVRPATPRRPSAPAPLADFTLQPELPPESSAATALQRAITAEAAAAAGARDSATAKDPEQESLKRRSSRDMGAKIAEVRKQQRHEEGLAIEARGDQFAAEGREDEAIDEWMRAAQASSQVARREDLLRKVGGVQRRQRRRRGLRRTLSLVILLAVAVLGIYLVTPEVHRRLSQREFQVLAQLPVASRLAELDQFIDRTKPYGWYVQVFQRGYELPVIAYAQQQRNTLVAATTVQPPHNPVVQADREGALLERLIARTADPQATWKQLESEATNIRAQITDPARRAQVDSIISAAQAGQQAVEQALSAIDAARQAGRHAEALGLAAGFLQQHPRAGAGVPVPAPGRLTVTVEGQQTPPAGLRVTVDGVALVGSLDHFCRDPARTTQIEISAPGYLTERRSIPPGSGEAVLPVQLKPGRLWQVRTSQLGPWWSLETQDTEHVLVVGSRAFLTVRLSDGAILQSVERKVLPVPPVGFDPGWTMFQREGPEQVLVATSDGVVARLSWEPAKGLGLRELLRKGSVGVSAFLERELVLQPGRRAQIQVESHGPTTELVAWSGQDQLWRVKGLLSSAQPPFLTAAEERICLVDDQGVHLYEEDGSDNGSYDLAAPRTAKVVPVGRTMLAIPTSEGVELLRLGGQPHFLEPLVGPGLSRIGQASIAGDGDDLLVADLLGGVRLFRAVNGQLSETWKAALPHLRKPVGQVLLTATYAAVVDDGNTIHLFSRADGSVVRRYEHPVRPVLAPLPIGRRLVILDPGGQLTAYHLPE